MSLSGGLTAGLVAGLTSRAMGGVSVPAAPTLDGISGLVWAVDPSPVSTGVSVGATVATVADASGGSNPLAQATAGNRPTLRQRADGGYYLDYDAVNDGMVAAGPSVVMPYTLVWAETVPSSMPSSNRPLQSGTLNRVASLSRTNNNAVFLNGEVSYRIAASGRRIGVLTVASGDPHVYIDGVETTTNPANSADWGTPANGAAGLIAESTGGSGLGRQAFFSRVLSASEIDQVSAWARAQTAGKQSGQSLYPILDLGCGRRGSRVGEVFSVRAVPRYYSTPAWSYQWTVTDGAGVAGTLTGATTALLSFTPGSTGTVRLTCVATATDGRFVSADLAVVVASGGDRISTLGDSYTVGGGSVSGTGYQGPLDSLLTADSYAHSFVGPFPPLSGTLRRAGVSGNTISQIGARWRQDVGETLAADTVILWAGANDVKTVDGTVGAADRLLSLLDEMTTTAPTARVILPGLPPAADFSGREVAYNAAVQAGVATRAAGGLPVTWVSTSSLVYPGDFWDALHPNDTGYAKVADLLSPVVQS